MSLRPRGFTLVEMLVGIAVSSVIMVAVAAAVIGVSGAYSNESQVKSAVESGRTAVAFLERNIRMAGYGIEPQFAFDFSPPTGISVGGKDNTDVGNGYITDDLAFRYRDPYFLRRGTAALSTSTLNLTQRFGTAIDQGQPFIVACPGGGQRAWFRASSSAAPTATSVGITPYSGNNGAPPTALDCIGQGGDGAPYVFLLKEVRVRVTSRTDADGFTRAYLTLFRDLSQNVVTSTGEPLAADVEEFQVAYQMNRPHLGSNLSGSTPPDGSTGNWIIGDAAGEALPNHLAGIPALDEKYDSTNRYNNHPANIRAVRINLSVRGARKEQGGSTAFVRTARENGAGEAAGDGYFRTWLTSSIRTPNMMSRAFFLPPVGAEGNHDGA